MILEAKIRKPKNTHLLREEGILPAVIYGAGVESTPIAIKGTDFISAITKDTDSATMEISIDGTVHHVLLQEMAHDPVSGRIVHADFLAIDMNKKATVSVSLTFEGEAPIVKSGEGKLVKVAHELEIEALPTNLPSEIIVDISGMDSMDSVLHANDLSLPEGCTIINHSDEDIVVASIATVTEVSEEEESMSTEEALASIEVTGEKPTEEEN